MDIWNIYCSYSISSLPQYCCILCGIEWNEELLAVYCGYNDASFRWNVSYIQTWKIDAKGSTAKANSPSNADESEATLTYTDCRYHSC